MKVRLSNTKMIFSDQLVISEKIKKGNFIFVFKIKDENKFGFQVADEEQAKYMVCAKVKEDYYTGFLYIQPTDPPVGFIKATMRLNFHTSRNLSVEKLDMGEARIFVIQPS